MRYQTGHAEVQAEGFGQTVGFGIANSAKAFKGLIDGIYSRKIEAPMRELATNAFDGHKAAGYVGPFDLHLPTVLSPTFSIRDYGTGMGHEFMMSRFAVMFDSTKDGLNAADTAVAPDDQVGCLGLGRMAFFAYTDACTITNWQDGMVRLYSVYMSADGVPAVSFAGEAPSDEPSGVKVEFAVKKKDYASFRTAAIRIFKGFPILPNGLPTDVRDAIGVTPHEIGSFWKSYPKDYLPNGGFYARQGCVLYPIDLVQIDENAIEIEDDEDDEEGQAGATLSQEYARFANLALTIVMDFPIGSLEFDLSRERLAYTQHTLRSLRSRWDEFTADIDVVVRDAFVDRHTGWERAITAGGDIAKLGPLFGQNSYFKDAERIRQALRNGFPKVRADRNKSQQTFFSAINAKADTSLLSIQPVYQRQYSSLPNAPKVDDLVIFYRDKDAGRYINFRVGQHLQKVGKTWGFILDKGGLSLRKWRELGCPPITRISQIDQLPKAVQQEAEATQAEGGGGGGVFDRVKVIADGGYRAPVEGEDTSDHLWAFLHRGFHVELDRLDDVLVTRHADLGVTDVMNINTISVALGGPAISFVNCRSNDKPDRFAGLTTFYAMYDKLAERFPKELVGRFVRIHNQFMVRSSDYMAVFNCLSEPERTIRDDLTRLINRYNNIGKAEELDGLIATIVCDESLHKLRNDLLRIAADMGMDVLVPDPTNLLSARWEKALTTIRLISNGYSGAATIVEARAAARTLLRKDAQC